MDEARYVLCIEITQNRSKKLEEVYINKILECFRMYYSKPLDTPVKKGLTVSLDQCRKIDKEKERMSNVPYASAVGSLMYTILCIRPDIFFALGMVSHY